MKQRLLIGTVLALIVATMIGLNAASYVQEVTKPDTESSPNRSTYNSGSTGTKAYFQLLSETGRRVSRWQSLTSNLNLAGKEKPSVFVLIGPLQREFEENEPEELLRWVMEGGRLVVIDRDPNKTLLATTSNWLLSVTKRNEFQETGVDPADRVKMTNGANASRPLLLAALTSGVNAIQPSQFASSIEFKRIENVKLPDVVSNEEVDEEDTNARPTATQTPIDFSAPPASKPTEPPVDPTDDGIDTGTVDIEPLWLKAPVAHFESDGANLAVEVPYGGGKIIFVSDPFIVANSGIATADNARFATNLVDGDGPIAFDEFHHGFGSGKNRLIEYFAGTPVVAIFLQLCLLVALVFYSQSRRFARPMPEPEPDRLSKLEYVGAMAELQRRTRAYDLAVENIYTDIRLRASRLLGVDPATVNRRELAKRIAERVKRPEQEIDDLFRQCEDVSFGGPADQKTTVRLVGELRELESELRLGRGGRA